MICMKKFKKVIAMCLTAVMALSVMSVGAFAAEEPTLDTAAIEIMEQIPVISENGIMPLGYPVPTRSPFYGPNSGYGTFVIPAGEPNFKVWVNNLSEDLGSPSTYTIDIIQASTGLSLPSFTVAAGGDTTATSRVYNGYGPGEYIICITNADGFQSVKGEITVRSSYNPIAN